MLSYDLPIDVLPGSGIPEPRVSIASTHGVIVGSSASSVVQSFSWLHSSSYFVSLSH